jgi:hypothetical protein
MSQTIKGLDHRCQRLELCSQQTLTAVETGNFQTASILKALSAEGEGIGADSVSTATDGSAINKKAIRLLISASRTEDERKSAGECKRILELFHDSSDNKTVSDDDSDSEKGGYSAITSAIAPACWEFVAPHAAGIEQALQQLDSLSRETSILESLRFDDMLRREDDITEAFGATYTWAFDAEASPLSTWLQTGTGIFWISGKPGSGKSTFMKALATTRFEQTSATLRLWSGPKNLLVLKHFFWSTGTALQSSYKGLLEGLVYQAFRQDLNLIRKACPVRWAETSAAADISDLPLWSEVELREALVQIIDQTESTHAFCFIIDGLDEFAENHYALVRDTIEYFATRSNVKLCVSSRPYNVFNNSLGAAHRKKLRMELMNKKDIDQFVKGKLEQNQLFRDLAEHDARAQELAVEIRKRAEGVFLWVHLVVWELMDGLGESDDIATLHRRLDMLPEDLETFFKHIIQSVDRVYRGYTAKCLLLAQRAREPLPMMAYAFLYEEGKDPAALTCLTVSPMSREDIRARRALVTNRISSWCKGLMEVKDMPKPNAWEPLRESRVDFLHLSVKDFIVTPYMQRFLMEHAGADFQPEYKLVQLFTAIARVVDVRELDDEMRVFQFMADEALYYANAHEKILGSSNGRFHFEVQKELSEIERSLKRGRTSRNGSGLLQVTMDVRGRSRSSSSSKSGGRSPLSKLFAKLRD